MIKITGRILTINVVSQKLAQIVLKKQVAGKLTPIAINVFGFWKDKMDELKLLKNEKIGGTIYLKSNLYKGKYYTEVYFKEIERIQQIAKNTFFEQNKKTEQNLFDDDDITTYIVDEETGEIIL